MNDAAYEAFRAEVLGGEINHDLTEPTPEADQQDHDAPAGDYGARNFLSAEDLERMAAEQDGPISEDAQIKDSLREQSHRYHFGAPDLTDTVSDDELWEATPKPWRPNDE